MWGMGKGVLTPRPAYRKDDAVRYVSLDNRQLRRIQQLLLALVVGTYAVLGALLFFLWRTKSLLGLW